VRKILSQFPLSFQGALSWERDLARCTAFDDGPDVRASRRAL